MAAPILVYNRIAANRRQTRLLLISFALVLLPAVSGIGVFLIGPLARRMYDSWSPAEMAALSAQMRAVQPAANGAYYLLDLPKSLLWLYASANLVSMVIVLVVLLAFTALLISRYGSRVILRVAHARPVDSAEEPEFLQLVEKLCIGAGLPIPRVHVIESAAANAFATGHNPHDASLVVTRGLLRLLDRRELEGVIAHELAHIGNHDIRLSTTLAALVGTLSLPIRVLSAPFRFAFRARGALGLIVMIFVFKAFFGSFLLLPVGFIVLLIAGREYLAGHSYMWWWGVYAMVTPLYAVFVAPMVALLIRQAVSRQREFLADADAALLTRDPEALALALVKIGAVAGDRFRGGEGTVHLYFVDPLSKSWLHVVFPSHPPLEKRIELLARMGNGIASSAIQAAMDAGARFQFTKSGPEEVPTKTADLPRDEMAFFTRATESTGFTGFTRLYDRPVDGSRLLALLPEDGVLKSEGEDGDFVRVTTEDGLSGYVLRPAALRMQPAAAADEPVSPLYGHAVRGLTPLYEQPDGWSRVLAQLPESAVVTPVATEGHFIRVTTTEHQVGYVSRSAPLTALKNFQERSGSDAIGCKPQL